MNQKLTIDNYYDKSEFILLIILFFAAMNFQAKFFYFVFLGFFVMCISSGCLRVNRSCILYLLLGIIMGLYSYADGILEVIRRFAYLANYLVGYNLIKRRIKKASLQDDRTELLFRSVFIVSALGSFTHYMINFITNSNNIVGRNTIDFWSGETMSSTGQATLAALIIGLCCALFIYPNHKFDRWFAIVITVCVLLYNLILSGRTILVVYAVTLSVAVIYVLKNEENKSKKTKVILLIILAFSMIIILYSFNVFGIRDIVENSNLYLRFLGTSSNEILRTSRNERKILFLQNMYKYPLGGLHLRARFGYAHDLLLDGYDEFGFITFILLILIIIRSLKECLYCLKYSSISLQTKIILLCIYVSIFLEFSVEPIFAGMPWLFACFCLFSGTVSAIRESEVN